MAASRTELFSSDAEFAAKGDTIAQPPFHMDSLLSRDDQKNRTSPKCNDDTETQKHFPMIPSLHPITSSCIHPTVNGYQSPVTCYTALSSSPSSSSYFYPVPYKHKSSLPYYPSVSSWAVPIYPVHDHTAKVRKHYTADQLHYLEMVFTTKKYVSITERVEIARRIGAAERQVKMWFQNRRTKLKKETNRIRREQGFEPLVFHEHVMKREKEEEGE